MERRQECKAAQQEPRINTRSVGVFLLCEIVLFKKNALVLVGRDVVVPLARRWVARFQQPGRDLP
jgi:hypothetical protein